MTDINYINIILIDSTMILVFIRTMRHKKATAVAKEMGLTQPAVSHALKRLRILFKDPLFLRRAHGLEPTALARELEPKVENIIRLISQTIEGSEQFFPNSATTDLRIGAFDYELTNIIPKLVAKLRLVSPNINIHAFPLHSDGAIHALSQGQIDLSIGYFNFPTRGRKTYIAEKLHSEHYVLAARRGHSIFKGKLTLEKIAKEKHLLISPYGRIKNLLDHALDLQGLKIDIQTIVPSLFPALSILENSDLVVTLPKRVAEDNGQKFDIAHRDLPIEGGEFQIHAVRHVRDAKSPLHLWLLKILRELVTQ